MEALALAPRLGSDCAALVARAVREFHRRATCIQAAARGVAERRRLRECEVCEGCEELVHYSQMCGDQCRFFECCNVCVGCCERRIEDWCSEVIHSQTFY
jgi:hypothetical protein